MPVAALRQPQHDLAAPAARAHRRHHAAGGTGATHRRERTRRPAGWKLARSRAGASPPARAQFALPRAGPRTREARFRALKEAPDAVLAAKHDKDKQSARVWRAKRIVADVEDELVGMHVAIGNAADRNGVSPFLVYKALFWARADELSAAEE